MFNEVSRLEKEVLNLHPNIEFGARISFISGGRVSRTVISSLDSLLSKSEIPLKQVRLLSSQTLSKTYESDFILRNINFQQLLWNAKDRDYSLIKDLIDSDIIVITSGVVSIKN